MQIDKKTESLIERRRAELSAKLGFSLTAEQALQYCLTNAWMGPAGTAGLRPASSTPTTEPAARRGSKRVKT